MEQPIKVTAEIENLARTERIFAVPLWVNGTVDSSLMAKVAAGGKTTLTYTLSRAAGTYDLRLDRQIKSIAVTPPTPIPTATPAPTVVQTPTPTPTPPTSKPAIGWVIGILVAVAVVVFIVVLLSRRKQ